LLEFLEKLPGDCLVIHSDYDGFINGPMHGIKERYQAFKKPVVVSAECECPGLSVRSLKALICIGSACRQLDPESQR
jgi:molybdopterin-guanine dinucleotide biosynthesis protein A